MEPNNPQDQTLELEQPIEETLEEEVLEDDLEEDEEIDEELADLQAQNETLKAKLAKAEKAIVKNKKSSKKTIKNPTSNNSLSKEDIIFYSSLTQKGFTPDNIQQLEKVAESFGLTREEAVDSSIFTAYIEEEKRKSASVEASLPSSRGSRKAKKKATLNDNNLDNDTHRRLAMERIQKEMTG